MCFTPHTHPHEVENAQSARPRMRYSIVSGSGTFADAQRHNSENIIGGTARHMLKSIFPFQTVFISTGRLCRIQKFLPSSEGENAVVATIPIKKYTMTGMAGCSIA